MCHYSDIMQTSNCCQNHNFIMDNNCYCESHQVLQHQSMSCMVPPSPDYYTFTLIHHEVQKLLQLISSKTYTQEALAKQLTRHHECLRNQITFKVILNILQKYSREEKLHPSDEDKIFHFLSVVPSAAKLKDIEGLMLIHHFAIMEDPPIFIIKRLVECYPASTCEYALFGYVEATPLHLILLKNCPNFQLATYMVDSYPSCVRCETIDGKLPLHLFADIPWAGSSYRIEFFEKLLQYHPKGLFQEITEELHYLCPIAEDPSTEGNEIESRQRQMSEDDIFNGVHVLIGQDHYKMERQILTWSPLDKLRSLDQMEINILLDCTLQSITQNHLKQQWGRSPGIYLRR